MRHLATAAALAAATATAAHADDTVTTYTLDNGMDVVVIEDARAPVVVHMVWYDVGAADEPPGKSGIAHYLEHLLFKGTDDYGPGELDAIVDGLGGSHNAFTAQDYTGYFQRVASEHLGLMMELEADRMRDLRITQEDILVERDVVLEERAQQLESSPGALLNEQQAALQYMNHPYGIPIIGWRHEIEELALEDALDFYERFYAPNNATLVVAGDVAPEDVLALAKEHYGPLEPTEGLEERARPQEPPQTAARRFTLEDPRVSNPYVIRTYLAPERDAGAQEEAAALVVLAELMGGSSATSLMGRTLEQEEGVALYTGAFYSPVSLDDTRFGFVVMPVSGRSLEEAEADMDRMIATFLDEGVDTARLERIRSGIRAEEIYGRDGLQGRARAYGAALASGLTVEDVQAWPRVLEAVTEEDVMAAARRLLTPARSVTGYLTRPSIEGTDADGADTGPVNAVLPAAEVVDEAADAALDAAEEGVTEPVDGSAENTEEVSQ
ncbi:pitrilysin family protein [Jannaschia sp. Os4]|uniref:M16 family metallopeptidase n=1 Tax=Jannaschia sp. Os4 TaxID=2807617 RepID=UPI0031B5E207